MKFVRVTFGINCSPFLLSATIRHHLSRFPPSFVINELSENLYVDDFLSGADSKFEAQELFSQANQVMKGAGMILTKWSSNNSSIIGEDNKELQNFKKVLGMSWDSVSDCFTFVGVDLPDIEVVRYTKRVVLSLIARVFDPLGLVLPFTVTAKFLFQDIWRLGLNWDDDLPSECQESFKRWLIELHTLQEVSVPRQYLQGNWSDISVALELHAFGDASLKGYGACVYIRYIKSDGQYKSTLVRACARVAPLERKTLPRLELLGALVTAQLLCSVIRDLRLPPDTNYTCWSDSMVALGWIRSSPSRWKQWVANRVAKIQSLTNPKRWRHIEGIENPADFVTRGVSGVKLVHSVLWWNGPSILHQSGDIVTADQWSIPKIYTNSVVEAERKIEVTGVSLVCVENSQMFQMERWSTLNKAYRVIAWVLRFTSRPPKSQRAPSLSENDYIKARLAFVNILQNQYFSQEINNLKSGIKIPKDSKLVKFSPILDDDGFIRVGGRIQLSELAYESKHPLILPRCHGVMLLVKFIHLFRNQAGVDTMITCLKSEFEIIGVRQIAKAVKKACVSCQKIDVRACNEPTAPLPKARVTKSPVFTVTGIDFAGPIFCSDLPNKKYYICLFVCAVVRAIHLELVDSLTSEDFILAFRRFAALKRVPSIVYSDNGKNLVGGQRILSSCLGPAAPQWRFICPRSPWWGGWWERLVRSVKNGIRKTVGKGCLTKIQLQTCLCEVANSINSRPLTFVGSDVENKPPLTPNHFLAGQGNHGLFTRHQEDPDNISSENLCIREQEMLQRQEEFWKVWSSDYLRNLPAAYNKFKKQGNLKVGSVVLIKEDNSPRLKWVVGIVERLHVGRDGIHRSADLRTAAGIRTRAVQRLHNLEICDHESAKIPEISDLTVNPTVNTDGVVPADEAEAQSGTEPLTNARPIRKTKKPVKYDDFVCYMMASDEMDLVNWDGTTIKKEPSVEIEQISSEAATSSNLLSFEVKTIKQENEDSVNGVVYNCDAYPQVFEQEDVDEDIDEKTYKNVMYSSVFENNVDDVKENHIETKLGSRTETTELEGVNMYKCDVCHKCFTENSTLIAHMHLHTNERDFKCDVCLKSFTRRYGLTKHMRLHTNNLKPYECDVCLKFFCHKSSLTKHIRTHNNEKPFQCDICYRCFRESGDLKRHNRLHTNERPFECDVCTKCFTERGHLTTHMRLHKNAKPFECDICHKCYSQSGSLTRHKVLHTNEKPFECDVCHKSYSQSHSLTRHKLSHTNEKPFGCHVLQKCFSESGNLQTHMPVLKNEKPFECDVCHKSLSRRDSLTKHMRVHRNDRPFECDVCFKCFTERGNLTTHLRLHKNPKPFECDICHKCFSQSSSLTRHKLKHANEKPFECDICHKYFSQSSSLIRHKLIHTNEKPFGCHVCHKCFRQSSDLKNHMRIHKNDKPFQCDVS
ncbi:Zinc finger protein 271 [Nymphon striatum]|nr:Zinc finger protein 271 [Nymphon striatum]